MRIYYFVEGKCEELFLKYLIKCEYIKPGEIKRINVVNHILSARELIALERTSLIVFVYDTDVDNIEILKANHQKISNLFSGSKLIHLQSVKTLEEEIVNASELKTINEMFKVSSLKEHKEKFCSSSNLDKKLKKIHLDYKSLWKRSPENDFAQFFDKNSIKDIYKN